MMTVPGLRCGRINAKIDGLKNMYLRLQVWRHFRYLSIPSLKLT